MEINEELLEVLMSITDRFDAQIKDVKRRNSNFGEFEYEFNSIYRNEGVESLQSKKTTTLISACMDYIKQLNKDMLIYNDYINRLATFQTDNAELNEEINSLIRRSQDVTDLITTKYNNLVRLTHEFIENPNEENIEEISRIFNRNTSEEIQYELNSIENSVSNVVESLNSGIRNNSFNVTVVPNNYKPTDVYDRSIPNIGYITRNNLGKGTNTLITNGLKAPEVSLDDVINFSHRIHNIEQSASVSYDGKTTFTDDEFLYQEFLSYVTFKMREEEPDLSLKLEGLSLGEKRELLDKYKDEIINEITANIAINGNTVSLNNYILETSAYLYVLRINGYDVNRNTDLNTFIRDTNIATLIRKEPVDQKQISNDFNTKYSKTHLDDANISKILNEGRAITEERFNETNKVINKIGELEI